MKEPYKEYLLEDFYGEDYLLTPMVRTYKNNKSLAIFLYGEDDEWFCDITVNLPENQLSNPERKDIAFVDTNNSPWLPAFIEKHGLGKPTGNYGMSGFCVYPEYEFDLSKLNTDADSF